MAHPRSRGENMVVCDRSGQSVGSSPLTRGKRVDFEAVTHWAGLIPAHAGKTWRVSRAYCRVWAHPRSRGENITRVVRVIRHHGSSPLTRGKLFHALMPVLPQRLIPAHAGKTAFPLRTPSGSSAHPRSRGENPFQRCPLHRLTGSSPLTRGKQRNCDEF